jgi:hypothetical protein
MTVSNTAYLKGLFDQAKTLGDKAISSDFALEIEGFESMWMLAKQCPWPVVTPGGEIEVSSPLGGTIWQPQQAKTALQGQVSLQETVHGSVNTLLINLLTKGGRFNAKIYEGTPQRFLNAKRIVDAFLVVDNPDRDWENRSQVLMFTGTMFFHYFNEDIAGNTPDYR